MGDSDIFRHGMILGGRLVLYAHERDICEFCVFELAAAGLSVVAVRVENRVPGL